MTGRVAVVTGASRGLGAGLVERFREQGLRVGACARSMPVADDDDLLARPVDVTDSVAVASFAGEVAERLGPVELWVNNAGLLAPMGPVRDLDPDEVAEHVAVNLLGVFHGSQAFVGQVRARDGEGVLVNVTSGAALRAYEGWGPYCASKAGVDRLTEVIALEEADSGVRAYAVAPGVVDTDMQVMIRSSSTDDFPARDRFVELKEREAFNSPAFVADQLLAIAFDPSARPDEVVSRLPAETAR